MIELTALPAAADTSTSSIPRPDQTIVMLDDDLGDAATNSVLDLDPEYAYALRGDPIKNARQLISVCRVSGQRREEFKNTIIEGNEAGSFGEGVELPKSQLLRDVDTRWSSTFLMIDRLLELYPAVQNFMKKPNYEELACHLLSEKELDVLVDIRGFLLIPHRVQELLSADQTPTASMTLPAYEELLELLKLARDKYSKIVHGIEASISVLEQYLRYTRQTRVYALAMVINPSVKLKWLEKNWTAEEVTAAQAWMREAMLDYRKREREDANAAASAPASTSSTPQAPSSPTHLPGDNHCAYTTPEPSQALPGSRTSRSLRAGFESLQDLRRELSTSSVSTSGTSDSNAGTNLASTSRQDESEEEREARLDAEDAAIVDAELTGYIEEGLSSQDVDLLTYWDTHSKTFPDLFRVALDILPVPASSVASERVFSSSKETDTLRRTGLDAAMMEILQVLKYAILKESRELLNTYTAAPPPPPDVENELRRDEMVTPAEASSLVHPGRLETLLQLVHKVHGDSD
ncbi:hypothetical protein TRAPUB_12620 [Trametes pubescens]|uniref:HAT C-terminal dimerisation domain-containing protein n=1 Tax=Trametes pubescens TaxID=154538 RepID=A0A1M2VTB8_TRAPU|nr:hypothetical protein TRAPUB_12620 [Trametes pubescens]